MWAGGGGDDLAKSPHLARIANSVFRDHCPGDVPCAAFGFVVRSLQLAFFVLNQGFNSHYSNNCSQNNQGKPSRMMERSLLYNLHGHKMRPGVEVDPSMFEEVYRSKYGKVRIFKIVGVSRKSKTWVVDSRECDGGGWFCPGKYPPALKKYLDKKKDFAQLEDFNRDVKDEDYQKEYFQNLNDPNLARRRAEMNAGPDDYVPKKKSPPRPLTDEEKQEIYNTFEDTEDTTLMWKLVSSNAIDDLQRWLEDDPGAAWLRSADGRGPMWWAFEYRHQEIVTLLMQLGVPHTDKDKNGASPVDILK